ncbi:MAG: hypothetical protein LBC88_02835 [Spirochaetaceae bacterium]|jgi:hypothetical protein|nr:hypothetical protein [Spirochaetaceae bacterium]
MNTNLLTVLNKITADYGEEVLDDPRRLKAFFSDLAKDEPKPLRTAFGKCVESGFYRILKDTKTPEERREVIDRLAQRLRDEEGLDSALCAEALELLAAAIFGEGQIAPPPAPAVAVTPAAAPPPVMHESPAEPPAAPAATVTPPAGAATPPAKPRRKRAPAQQNAAPALPTPAETTAQPTPEPAETAKPPEPPSAPEEGADDLTKSETIVMILIFLFMIVWCVFIFEILGYKSIDNLSAGGLVLFAAVLFGPLVLFVIRVLNKRKKKH